MKWKLQTAPDFQNGYALYREYMEDELSCRSFVEWVTDCAKFGWTDHDVFDELMDEYRHLINRRDKREEVKEWQSQGAVNNIWTFSNNSLGHSTDI